MALYFIKRSCSLGIVEKSNYIASINLAEKFIMNNTRSDGRVLNSQGDCIDLGIYSSYYIPMPFTQGMVLRAICIEI